MKRRYARGLDILGQETNRAVLIRVHNADELARSQGAIATFAQTLAPATIEAKVYDTLAQRLKKSLAAQNVDADVSVVESSAFKPAGNGHIARDVGLAVASLGGVALLFHLFRGKKK